LPRSYGYNCDIKNLHKSIKNGDLYGIDTMV